jgi:hypothetical protein
MLLYVLLAAILVLIIVGLSVRQDSKGILQKFDQLFMDLEGRYADFMERNLHLYLHKVPELGDLVDEELLVKDMKAYLLPQLQALVQQINQTYLVGIKINWQASYFPNIVLLSERFLMTKNQNPQKILLEEEVQQLNQALEEAILIDLRRRLLQFKIS